MATLVKCFIGPMFAGKTTRLLNEVTFSENAIGNVDRSLIITHKFDEARTDLLESENIVSTSSHSPETRAYATKFETVRVHKLSEMTDIVSKKSIVGIDECQFFDKQDFVETIKFWLTEFSSSLKVLILVGLDGDIIQRPFPGSGIFEIMPLCNVIEKLQGAYCNYCTAPAHFTILSDSDSKDKDDNGNIIKIGGSDMYKAVCRVHL